MKKKIINPFITGGYISPEYFCDRQIETGKILNAIRSGRNLTLISLRRVGKTGLLKHFKYKIEHSKNSSAVIYIDLLSSCNANDMLNALSTALIQIKKEERNFFEKFLTSLSSLRPRLTYDSLTGQPSIELKIESNADIQSGLDNIIRFIAEINKDLVVIFDEFQQIGNYPEKNIEHILRTIIQSYPQIAFIFSGSSKHMLENMFLSAGRPFYQSSELMYLDNIREEDYSSFISSIFSREGKTIEPEALSEIFKWTRLHTWYVQYVCNLLFERDEKIIKPEHVHNTFHKILMDFEPLFVSYRNLIPGHQFRMLQAIASENGVTQPTSGSFINKYNLTSASSVTTSLKALAEKEMIIKTGKLWLVYDVFFSRWLEYHYNG
jgi:AAA+ ATPase superfamily predicted ATPase